MNRDGVRTLPSGRVRLPKEWRQSDGISGGVPGELSGPPNRMEVGMEVEDEEMICPVCSGTGEAGVGWGDCYECGGDGGLREEDDYEDLVAMNDEWERGMR